MYSVSITKKELMALLEDLFEVPAGSAGSLYLSDYIKDSIDVGELLAALKIRYQIFLDPTDFRKIISVDDLWALIKAWN